MRLRIGMYPCALNVGCLARAGGVFLPFGCGCAEGAAVAVPGRGPVCGETRVQWVEHARGAYAPSIKELVVVCEGHPNAGVDVSTRELGA
jgi:hypothetical protein